VSVKWEFIEKYNHKIIPQKPRQGGQRGGGKKRRSPPAQPRPAFALVSGRFLFSELIVFIKGSEPDAFFLAQILTITAGLFRRRDPQELPPPRCPPCRGIYPLYIAYYVA